MNDELRVDGKQKNVVEMKLKFHLRTHFQFFLICEMQIILVWILLDISTHYDDRISRPLSSPVSSEEKNFIEILRWNNAILKVDHNFDSSKLSDDVFIN